MSDQLCDTIVVQQLTKLVCFNLNTYILRVVSLHCYIVVKFLSQNDVIGLRLKNVKPVEGTCCEKMKTDPLTNHKTAKKNGRNRFSLT